MKLEERQMSFQLPITIAQVIEGIENNAYLLPAIQREFVWDNNKIEWLFDSLMRDYPISSFLFWRVEGKTKNQYKFYSFLKDFREKYKTHNDEFNTSGANDFMAVLDGQQRLTSLYIGLKGSYAFKKANVWWVDNEQNIPTRYLYLNIQEPLKEEEDGRIYEFKFLTNDEYNKEPNKWFKVGEILNLKGRFAFDKYLDSNKLKENEFSYETLSILHEKVFTTNLINYFLETEQDIDKALNIFIRINSGGEPLDFSDLIMSIAVANWTQKDARTEIFKLIDEIRDNGFFITKDFILKVFLVLHSSNIKFKVTNFSAENAKDFELKWDNIRAAICNTFELIKTFGYTESTLTSKNALIPIIYYIYHRNIYTDFSTRKCYEQDRIFIRKWLNIVLVKRIFGGQADNILTTIRGVFTEDVTKNAIDGSINLFPKDLIVDRLKGTTKDMTMDDDYIDNLLLTQKDNGLAFSILSLLYPNLDYKNGNFHKDHLHPEHFFKADKYLKQANIPQDKYEYYKDSNNWNSIFNLQLLDANENMSKQDKNLKDWVNYESKKQTCTVDKFCEEHVIPNILEFTEFEIFINQRRKMLRDKIKSLV
jgi:uncharacterized protein with ParB-like and HNH nuclease domain